MRTFIVLTLLLGVSSPGIAQVQGGGTGGGGGGGGGGGSGATGGGGSGGGGFNPGNFGGQSVGSIGGNIATAGISNQSILGGFQNTGQTSGRTGTSANTVTPGVSTSNILAGTYGNPLAGGGLNTKTTNIGFGSPLYPATNSSTLTGAGVGAGALGRGGQAGFGGTAAPSLGSLGRAAVSTRAIAVVATVRFKSQIQAPDVLPELQSIISRSSALREPAGVRVVRDGSTIILRGTVNDEDELRIAEGLVRLTPGVREIRNELTVKP